MEEFLPEIDGIVIDIGIGVGYFESLYGKKIRADVIGVDNDIDMLAKCKIALKVLADGDALPFRKNAFHGMVCLDAIHLIKKKDYMRVLKPYSFIMVSNFFNKYNLEEKRRMLKNKIRGYRTISEKISYGKENEVILFAKSHPLKHRNS